MNLYLKYLILASVLLAGCSNDDNLLPPDILQPDVIPGDDVIKPNFIIIIADDLNTRDLGCYGGINVPTPNIDKLAKDGMRFTNAFTSSAMCTPVRSSLYTGLYPVKNGAHKNSKLGIIKPGIACMPAFLGIAGYRIGLTGKTHIHPIAQFNFEEVPGFTKAILGLSADYDVEEIKPFMTRNDKRPFCLVVASTLPHAPWTVGDKTQFDPNNLVLPQNWFDTDNTRSRYRDYLAEVSALDNQVKDILKALDETGKANNTLVLFLGEQGAQFAGNKWTLWDEGLHSAVIARWPGVINEETVSDQLIQYVDVLPTLIDAAKQTIPSGLDGESFYSILGGGKESIRQYVYGIHSNIGEGTSYPIRSIRDKNFKLIWNLNFQNEYYNKYVMKSNYFNSWIDSASQNETAQLLVTRYTSRPEYEFYDLTADPFELSNLINDEKYQDDISEMKSALVKWMDDQGDAGLLIDS